MHPEDKLAQLGLVLPPVAVPAASYVPFVQTGNLLFLSGHIPKRDGVVVQGQLGRDMGTAEAQAVAREVALDLMGTMKAALGDLGRVLRVVKVMGLVNCTGDYTEQHVVLNGCSEFFAEVFGEAGVHARSAFGVAQLPLGACVEIELVAEVRPA